MSRRQVMINGQQHEAVSVDFESEREAFNTYILHDGSTLKVKVVLTEVMRVEGAWSPNGDPLYMVQAQQILSVNAPDTLRRKTS